MEEKILEKSLDVANKTMDLANKVYDDGFSKPVKTIGNGLSMCLSFLGATVSPVMYEYIQNAEYKKQEIDQKLSAKYAKIPEDKRIDPRMNILGPAVELLKYNLDEEYIKEMFVNIMCNEMNSDKQHKVLPSYIEIVRQLSKEDAKMIKTVYDMCKSGERTNLPLLVIRIQTDSTGGYIERDKYVIDYAYVRNNRTCCHSILLNSIVVDNLCRLGLIKLYDDRFISEENVYELGFNVLKNKYTNTSGHTFYYQKGLFEITQFGKNFIDICFN